MKQEFANEEKVMYREQGQKNQEIARIVKYEEDFQDYTIVNKYDRVIKHVKKRELAKLI